MGMITKVMTRIRRRMTMELAASLLVEEEKEAVVVAVEEEVVVEEEEVVVRITTMVSCNQPFVIDTQSLYICKRTRKMRKHQNVQLKRQHSAWMNAQRSVVL